jgi:hypothetical protein
MTRSPEGNKEGNQSQYNPLSLLNVYMIKWKLLMRSVTMRASPVGWKGLLEEKYTAQGYRQAQGCKVLKMHQWQEKDSLKNQY